MQRTYSNITEFHFHCLPEELSFRVFVPLIRYLQNPPGEATGTMNFACYFGSLMAIFPNLRPSIVRRFENTNKSISWITHFRTHG